MNIYKCRFCSANCEVKPKGDPRTATCVGCRKINHRFRRESSLDHIMLTTWFVNQIQECVECGARSNLTIDRIIPGSRGGKYEQGNLQILCYECNCCKKIASRSVRAGLRDVKKKRCLVCKKTKPLTAEYWHRTSYSSRQRITKSMFHPDCKKCRNKKESRRWAANNPKTRNYWQIKYPENYKSKINERQSNV